MNQREQVLHHMKRYGSITSMDAINLYGITRLSGRIYDLRNRGVQIVVEHEKVPTRTGEITYIARYSLAPDNK